MDTATIIDLNKLPADELCIKCRKAIGTGGIWEVMGLAPVCDVCARKCDEPKDRHPVVHCANCGTALVLPSSDHPSLPARWMCPRCLDQHSPAQSPGASHAPASATASASPAGAAAGESACRTCKVCGEQIRPGYPQVVGANVCMRCWPEYVAQHRKSIDASHSPLITRHSHWYDRPLLTAGLPIGVASLLLIAAAVDRVVDSGAPWHEVGEILSAMAPVLGTFAILLALCVGWMLRSLSRSLRDASDNGPEADAGLVADYNEAVEALKDAHSLIIRHHDCTVTRIEPGHFCPVCHRPDGSEPEIDQLHSAIQRHTNRTNRKS